MTNDSDQLESGMVYVVIARNYDCSGVAGVYPTREAAEEARDISSEERPYSFFVREFEITEEPTVWEGRI